jgi:parallel beta-helix repeat protein
MFHPDASIRANTLSDLRDFGPAISLDSASNSTVEDNEVANCPQQAIVLSNSNDVFIARNSCKGGGFSRFAGIHVAASSSAILADNSVIDWASHGMEIAGSGCQVTSCVIQKALRDGVFIDTSAAGTLFDGNLVEKCLTEGLDHRGSNSIIQNNVLRKSRRDLTNDGSGTFTTNQIQTGGEAVGSDLD